MRPCRGKFAITAVIGAVGALLLLAVAMPAVAQRRQRVKILIGFDHLPGQAEEALVKSHRGHIQYTYHLVPAMAVTVPETAIEGLRRSPHVTVVEADGLAQAIDAELDNTWGVKRIGSGPVHDSGNRGAGVKVAIVDTGIDCTHPDLDGNCMGGYDFVNNDPDPMDDHGHGTHVAGTVAAQDDGGGVVGVAPQASLYALKVLGATGSGYWSDIIAAIEWAADNGIQVTNNSYGGSADPGTVVKAAYDNSYALGVLHIAAAGNSGSCSATGDTVGYPAKFDSVMAVAATDSSDQRACFSSTGPAVEMAAPGVSVNSTRLGGGYVQMSGTSMASPHVAGAAALVIASQINDPVLVRQRLGDTADDLGQLGQDPHYGFGLVNAAEAVVPGPVNYPPTVAITSPASGARFESGASIFFQGSASDPEDGDRTANLAWTSSLDGQIGTGGSFSANLSVGQHMITARATDLEGKTGRSSTNVTVTTPGGTVRVVSVNYGGRGGRSSTKHLTVTLVLRDDSSRPVQGALVTARVDNQQTQSSWQEVGTSDASGVVQLSIKNAPNGCYRTTVMDVVANGFEWDGLTPANSWCR